MTFDIVFISKVILCIFELYILELYRFLYYFIFNKMHRKILLLNQSLNNFEHYLFPRGDLPAL